MPDSAIQPVSTQSAGTQVALRKLNNAHARETSHLTPTKWQNVINKAYSAICFDGSEALLIAFDQDAVYDNANFSWFHARFSRFIYIDRIVVSEKYRGLGVAKRMYRHLFEAADQWQHRWVVCEINLMPPNRRSDAFHQKLGFHEVGRATLTKLGKSVRYIAKDIRTTSS